MEYRVLGPLEVLDASGQKVSLGGAMQQSVLASLLLRAGQTVALDRLIDELWDEPPATAARTVQAYVSRLRRKLPEGAIARRAGGYEVVLAGDELDLTTFEQRAEDGHAALAGGDYERSATLLGQALALWRGPALGGLTSDALRREAERLEEQRLVVLEDRIDADLGAGRHAETVGELSALVSEHPFRERLRAQLMTALYRSGRPSDALAVYRDVRRVLVDELAMEPGQELRELEQAILRQDAELAAPTTRRSGAGARSAVPEAKPPVAGVPPHELRKTVTVLFSDLVGSTAQGESTDPEVMRALLARYFKRMKEIVEHHGGTVEKFIGDAVMAVFGVPFAHEDDALRGCRAALEMRENFARLGVEGRVGLATGEVVTGTEERLATGDAVNVAARLEQVAESDDVLLDAATLELVRAAVDVEALPPLALKGRAKPVEAYRLVAAHEAPERLRDTPFVGRKRELAALRKKWEGVLGEELCELFTIVGEAGVGKSRLVAEALRSIDARAVRGRCLPYGDGITYWPAAEVIRALDTVPTDPTAASAIASLLGDTASGITAEEIAWGFRRLLEEQAPLIVVFEDIEHGDDTFLDLVEHAVLLLGDAPVLLVCIARLEFTERRPHWPIALRLEPLPEADVDDLIPKTLAADLRRKIKRASGGNPLFVTEMVELASTGKGAVAVPPSLRALLTARLDQLEGAERFLLERAAIEGEVFHLGAVQALSDGRPLAPRLASLVRKGLIRSAEPQISGEVAFRFRHLLIKDVAYDALSKAARAHLHECFATWLERRDPTVVELDQILGFHLEQAARYMSELGQDSSGLARLAGEHLARASRSALIRGDLRAEMPLLERALALTRPLGLDVRLELDFAIAHAQPRERAALAKRVAERARECGNAAEEALAQVVMAEARSNFEDGMVDEVEQVARAALPLLEQSTDNAGLADVWFVLGGVANTRGQFEEMARSAERGLAHLRLAGVVQPGLHGLPRALILGPRPADEALRALDLVLRDNPAPWAVLSRACLLAMLGRFADAWELALSAEERWRELWGEDAQADERVADIPMLEGDPATAVRYLRRTCARLERQGNFAYLSTYAPMLGRALCALGEFEEADPLASLGADLGDEQDFVTQMLWRQVRALVCAKRGEQTTAVSLATEAVNIAERTDSLNYQGDALCDLADVHRAAGRAPEAAEALEQALDRYERKRNLAMGERVRARLADLEKADGRSA
jgi:class 3 adenylate cyclase/tetratricopeptide (TPR) repeat protein